jgi:hypothetical protein
MLNLPVYGVPVPIGHKTAFSDEESIAREKRNAGKAKDQQIFKSA